MSSWEYGIASYNPSKPVPSKQINMSSRKPLAMLGLLFILLGLVVGRLANVDERPPLQVGLALRSDAVVLVQLGDEKSINYTIRKDADQEYQSFMTMMRHDQTNLSYLHEDDLYLQQFLPIQNRSLTQPAYPITNLHHAHVIARNLRPLIKQAELELGSAIKCDAIVIPSYGSAHDFRPFVRLASELAGCGSVGYQQILGLHRVLLWAYDLDLVDGKRLAYGPGVFMDRVSLLIEVEASHIRISALNAMPSWVKHYCAYTCDRKGLSISHTLTECITRFKQDCLSYEEGFDFHSNTRRVGNRDIRKVFVSGTTESQQEAIAKIISTQFGDYVLDEMSFGIDPEILGAYGAARWARISGEVDHLRQYDTWDLPAFLDPGDF